MQNLDGYWVKLIRAIKESGTKAPDGYRWSYRSIGEVVGVSKPQIGRLATGEKDDIYFKPGKRLVDLYLRVTKEAEQRESND